MHSRNSCKTLKCPRCNWHYKYQETLEIHMKEKHPENELNCLYCLTNQSHPRLARGETYTCGYKPYRCEVCNYSTTTKGNLSIHMTSDKHMTNIQQYDASAANKLAANVVAAVAQQQQQQQQQQHQASSNNNNNNSSVNNNNNNSSNNNSSSSASATRDSSAQSSRNNSPSSNQSLNLITTQANDLTNHSNHHSHQHHHQQQQQRAIHLMSGNQNDQRQALSPSGLSSPASAYNHPIGLGDLTNNNSSSNNNNNNLSSNPTSTNDQQQQPPQSAAMAVAAAILLAQQNPNALEDYINSQEIAKDSYDDPARKYKCHRCKVAFTRQSYLTAHNKTLFHRKGEKLAYPMEKFLDPNRPFKCDICKESFTQKSILLVHNNSVSHLNKLRQKEKAANAGQSSGSFSADNNNHHQQQQQQPHHQHQNHQQNQQQHHLHQQPDSQAQHQPASTSIQSPDNLSSSIQTTAAAPTSAANNLQNFASLTSSPLANQLNLLQQQQQQQQQQQPNPLALLAGGDPTMAALMASGNPMAAALMMQAAAAAQTQQASLGQLGPIMNPFMMSPQLMAAAALAAAQSAPNSGVGRPALGVDPAMAMFYQQAAMSSAGLGAGLGLGLNPNNLVASSQGGNVTSNGPLISSQSSNGLAGLTTNSNLLISQSAMAPAIATTATGNSAPTTVTTSSISESPGLASSSPVVNMQQHQQQQQQNDSQMHNNNNHNPTISDFQAQQQQLMQQKRARTRISEDQLRILRQYFDINNSPTEEQLQEMSVKSELPLKVIKHWFRNTLFKERQKNKDSPYNFNNPPMLALNLEEYERTGEAKVTPISDLVTQSISAQSNSTNLDSTTAAATTIAPSNDSSTTTTDSHHHHQQQQPQVDSGVGIKQETNTNVFPTSLVTRESPVIQSQAPNNENSPNATTTTITPMKDDDCNDESSGLNLSSNSMSFELNNSKPDSNHHHNSRVKLELNDSTTVAAEPMELVSQVAASTPGQPESTSCSQTSDNKSIADIVSQVVRSVAQDEDAGIGPSATWSPLELQQQLFDQTWASVTSNQGLSSKTSDSSSHSVNSSSTNSKSKRANRTRFSDKQVKVLQEFFESNAYPKDDDLECLSRQLGLSPRVIVVWFQNARQKARKVYENRPNSGSVSEADDDFHRTDNYCDDVEMMEAGNGHIVDDDETSGGGHGLGIGLGIGIGRSRSRSVRDDEDGDEDEEMRRHDDNDNEVDEDEVEEEEEEDEDEFMSAAQMMRHRQQQQQQQQQQQLAAALFGGYASNLLSLIAANQQQQQQQQQQSTGPAGANPAVAAASQLLSGAASAELHQRSMMEALNFSMRTGASDNVGPLGQTNGLLGSPFGGNNQAGGQGLLGNNDLTSSAGSPLIGQLGGDHRSSSSHGGSVTGGGGGGGGGQNSSSAAANSAAAAAAAASQRDKRLRTQISPEQLDYLYQKYQVESNPSRKTLESIAQDVGLSKRVVQVWFQNTRARERRGQLRMSHVVALQQRKC